MQSYYLRADDGASAEIYDHGAHVTSWKTPDGDEQLYLSDRSEFRAGKAIRGGVPIIFPQFDALGPLPRHGFARTSEWEFIDITEQVGSAQARFRLKDSVATRAIWDFAFQVEYRVRVGGNTLSLELNVRNTDDKPFQFTCALHTYPAIDDISKAQVTGMRGITFRDKTRDNAQFRQESESLGIEAETDRIYEDAPDAVTLRDGLHTVIVEKVAFRDMVIWNPFDKGQTLKDLTPGGERHFVCIEAACISHSVALEPGKEWAGAQNLKVVNTDE